MPNNTRDREQVADLILKDEKNVDYFIASALTSDAKGRMKFEISNEDNSVRYLVTVKIEEV